MKKFRAFISAVVIGLAVGLVTSYSLGFLDSFLWVNNQNNVKFTIMSLEEQDSDAMPTPDAILECMAKSFVDVAILNKCNYSLFQSLDTNMIECVATNEFKISQELTFLTYDCISRLFGERKEDEEQSI